MDHTPVRHRWMRAPSLWRAAAAALVGLAAIAALYAFAVEPRRLVVRRVRLDLPNLPAGFAPLRAAVLSDLHAGRWPVSLARLRDVVARTNAERPDVVLLLGDYAAGASAAQTSAEPEEIAAALGELAAPHGVVAVLGNHDWWHDGERFRTALEAVGIVVLENGARPLWRPGGNLWIAGLADPWTRQPNLDLALASVPPGAPVILLAHSPDVFPAVPRRVALTLAGHTHGGQVKLPIIGRPIVPSRFGQRYAAGLVVEGGRHLFVTTGVGTSILPVRFGVPPEIVVLELGRKGKAY